MKNINLLNLYTYFIRKIRDTKIYNLDEESIFMEFENKVLNG
jgi:DNA polymerase-3 subunit delta'